jgi:hypothetical protein
MRDRDFEDQSENQPTNGLKLRLLLDGKEIAVCEPFVFTHTPPREATNKESEGWKDKLEGLRVWTMNTNALKQPETDYRVRVWRDGKLILDELCESMTISRPTSFFTQIRTFFRLLFTKHPM